MTSTRLVAPAFVLSAACFLACAGKSVRKVDDEGERGGATSTGGGTSTGGSNAGGATSAGGSSAGGATSIGGANSTGGASAGGVGGLPRECRRYAARFTETGPLGEFRYWCDFDRTTLTMSCWDDLGQFATTQTWATLEDAVAENRPLGRFRARHATSAIKLETVECRFAFDAYYDSLGRLTSVDPIPGPGSECSTLAYAYDAWDVEDRPTHGIANAVGEDTCSGLDVYLEYDQGNHLITEIHRGGTSCLESVTVFTYDEDSILVGIAFEGSEPVTYSTFEIGEICLD